MFELDPRLAQNGPEIESLFPDHLVIIMENRDYPWLVVVPQKANIAEVHELDEAARNRLFEVIARLSQALKQLTGADKINLDLIGNMVPQLHAHISARKKSDPLWPLPIWREPPTPGNWVSTYPDFVEQLRKQLSANGQ